MSLLDQMKLAGLIDLSLILFLVSNSEGQTWNITVADHINATRGSNVTILCTFTYPKKHHTKDVQIYWKKPGKNTFKTNDKDKNQFIFHTNYTFVLNKYRGKTKLIGNKANGNCSLRIENIIDSERILYVRVKAKGQNYSFYKNPVSISVYGSKPDLRSQFITSPAFYTPTATHKGTNQEPTGIYAAIFGPLSALIIIILVTALFCYMKQKRSKSFTKQESGYYANFSRSSSNQPQRDVSCKNDENAKLSKLKIIEDPIYVNTEGLKRHVDESPDPGLIRYRYKITGLEPQNARTL